MVYKLLYSERTLRCAGYISHGMLDILPYEYRQLRTSVRTFRTFQHTTCWAMRLSHLPSPYEITAVYGRALKDCFLWHLVVLNNLLGLLSYPFQVTHLVLECVLLTQGGDEFGVMRYTGLVNIGSWIAWSLLESIRWSKTGSWASLHLYGKYDPDIMILLVMCVVGLVANFSDMLIAINWLPYPILWANTIPMLGVGLLGTLSGVLGLIQIRLRQTLDDRDKQEDEAKYIEYDSDHLIILLMSVTGLLSHLSDMVLAINWFPYPILWADTVPILWVGLLGTLSALLGLIQIRLRQTLDDRDKVVIEANDCETV